MPRWINIFTQCLLLVCQVVNQFFEILPAKYKTAALVTMAMVQGAVAIIAHSYNPNGTNAALPWTDPKVIATTGRPPRPGGAGAVFMFTLLISLATGCAFPMAGGMDSSQTLEIMKAQNARGCLFIRGSATPWASAGFMAIGTWGTDPPPYNECFSGIPVIP